MKNLLIYTYENIMVRQGNFVIRKIKALTPQLASGGALHWEPIAITTGNLIVLLD